MKAISLQTKPLCPKNPPSAPAWFLPQSSQTPVESEEVLTVVKSLMLRDRRVGLSTGERRMLMTAKQILYSELTAALELGQDALEARLLEMLDA